MRRLVLPTLVLAAIAFAVWLQPLAPLSLSPFNVQAQVTCAALPFTFVNGTVADGTQVNSNMSSLRNCINNANYMPRYASTTALKAVNSTAYPVVERIGFTTAGDAPPLVYIPSSSACSLNSGAGDNGSQVQSADGKCWIAVFPEGLLDIRQFGGKGDNSTDNATPLTNALTAQPFGVTKTGVYFPAGTFKFLSQMSYTIPTGGAVEISGSGKDLTTLTWPSGSGGIKLTYSDCGLNRATVHDLTLTTGTTNGGDAINLTESQTSCLAPAQYPITQLYRLTIRGADGYTVTDYWTNGVNVQGVANINFDSVDIAADISQHGTCINLSGATATRVVAPINITNSMIKWCNNGVFQDTYVQGVSVSNTNFDGGVIGYNLPVSTGTSQLNITVSEFNTTSYDAQIATGDASIVGNLFLLEETNQHAIQLIGGTAIMIVGNGFQCVANCTGTFAVETTGTQGGPALIVGNAITNTGGMFSYPTASTSYKDVIYGNTKQGVSGNLNLGSGTKVAPDDIPVAFGNLVTCDTSMNGRRAVVADSNTATWGATIAGSSTNNVEGFCDATNWTVMGK